MTNNQPEKQSTGYPFTEKSRSLIEADPFLNAATAWWARRGVWPASWVDHPERPLDRPTVAVFRLRWNAPHTGTIRLHVSADNRYRLHLDGRPLGRGPERGSPEAWHFETYEVEIAAGEHTLTALTWWLHDAAPWAQMSVRSGFLCAASEPWGQTLDTGIAPWEVMLADGFSFPPIAAEVADFHFIAVGNRLEVDAARFPWGFETGDCAGLWKTAVPVGSAHAAGVRDSNRFWSLTPAMLPPMLEQERSAGTLRHLDDRYGMRSQILGANHLSGEAAAWSAMLAGGAPVAVPPNVIRRAVIDIGDYACAYPLLAVNGGAGATVSLEWAEALTLAPDPSITPTTQVPVRLKGNRDEVEGRYFVGIGDTFLPDGGRREFSTLWWEAGRYLCLTVRTGGDPLEIAGLRLEETRYPLAMEGTFAASDPQLGAILALGLRSLQMCSHETYMDCPYYEQLMYVGDTRLEALVTHVLTADARLPWKAVHVFEVSRRLSGFTRSAFPSHTLQIIPPFSLWWVNMVHDFWMWRDTGGRTSGVMHSVRDVLEAFHALRGADDLLAPPPEWNFADWVSSWPSGIPPLAETGPSALINLQYVLALIAKAELERAHGELELAARDERLADRTLAAVLAAFWDGDRGLLADDADRTHFSEHAQCLALLTGRMPSDRATRMADGLFTAPDLARTTIYFSHYYFEACRLLGRIDKLIERLSLWQELIRLGFKTTMESPEPTRSDCHAWGAHPIFHYYATLLGIRPAAPGFARVRIAPQPGALGWIEGAMPHPLGMIRVRLEREGGGMRVVVDLPPGLEGEFVFGATFRPLLAGRTEIQTCLD